MDGDGTHVELGELDALNTTFREVSDSIRSAAQKTGDIQYGREMFGVFAWLVAEGGERSRQPDRGRIVRTVRERPRRRERRG